MRRHRFDLDNICLCAPMSRTVETADTGKTRWNDQNAELHKAETARC